MSLSKLMPLDQGTPLVVLAAAAHPDDIEFMMAGTLLLLKDAGAEIHMWNLANGHCGTARDAREEIIRRRAGEAEASARLAGAVSHPPLFDDLGIFYDRPSLARVSAVVREIRPTIVLTQSPQDYMEDHQNTCRLLVTAAVKSLEVKILMRFGFPKPQEIDRFGSISRNGDVVRNTGQFLGVGPF